MASVNQAIIVGNIGQEPKVVPVQGGDRRMASFSVATTERGYTRKDGTKVEDSTDWHNVVLFGSLAEVAAKYLHKGSLVYIQGRIKTRSYDDKAGQKRFVTEIIGDTMQMLSKADRPQDTASAATNPAACAPNPNVGNGYNASYPTAAPLPPELKGRSVAEIFAAQNGAATDDLPF